MYRGVFNWKGEVHKMSTDKVKTEVAAFRLFCSVLSRRIGYSQKSIAGYFRGTDRYRIYKEEV